jgi:hypothetical protein
VTLQKPNKAKEEEVEPGEIVEVKPRKRPLSEGKPRLGSITEEPEKKKKKRGNSKTQNFPESCTIL